MRFSPNRREKEKKIERIHVNEACCYFLFAIYIGVDWRFVMLKKICEQRQRDERRERKVEKMYESGWSSRENVGKFVGGTRNRQKQVFREESRSAT